jgi:mannose/fructose/N-acetylgalactosamine-specific phosphotransferase system component IIC
MMPAIGFEMRLAVLGNPRNKIIFIPGHCIASPAVVQAT